MSTREALMRLGASTAEAIAKVLESLCPDQVERGDVAVLNPDTSPFATLETPAVAVSVAYVDGVTGGNVFLMTAKGARSMAASMMGQPAPEDDGTELTVLELSAVAEAANQMMAAAAAAIGVVLGQEVEIAPPETRIFSSSAEATDAYELAPHGTRATFRVCDEPCRLIQLVPNAFVVRMTRALDEMGVEHVSGNGATSDHGGGDGDVDEQVALDVALRDIRVKVWAELDARASRWAPRRRCRPEPCSSWTEKPRSRSTSTSTACASRAERSCSPTTASGLCASPRSLGASLRSSRTTPNRKEPCPDGTCARRRRRCVHAQDAH